MTETLAYVKSYLNAHRVICWLEEVIAQPHEINWFISDAALILLDTLCPAHLRVLDFAQIGVGRDGDHAIGQAQALRCFRV
jgi:hypothetical protein